LESLGWAGIKKLREEPKAAFLDYLDKMIKKGTLDVSSGQGRFVKWNLYYF
jgi:hypothetical protein